MEGTLVFLNSFVGSKSESLQPYLYLGGGETVRLFKTGDNPFEHESLRPFDGQRVVLTGNHNENQVFEVESISKADHADKTESEDTV